MTNNRDSEAAQNSPMAASCTMLFVTKRGSSLLHFLTGADPASDALVPVGNREREALAQLNRG